MDAKPLVDALRRESMKYSDEFDRNTDTRTAIELVCCLARLVERATADDIYRAFGAPGDFGYETPIGAALAKVYGL